MIKEDKASVEKYLLFIEWISAILYDKFEMIISLIHIY